MPLQLPRFERTIPLVDEEGKPTFAFHQWWQKVVTNLETAFNSLEDTVTAVAAAQAAADAANAAAAAADAAADAAQTTADNIADSSELSSSYVSGASITATDAGTDATANITAHTRYYPQPDGTTISVAVNAGSVTGLAYETEYFIYYDDAARTGGAVTYLATTDDATAAQIGDRHTVGAVTTPAAAAADTNGGSTQPPGVGSVKYSLV